MHISIDQILLAPNEILRTYAAELGISLNPNQLKVNAIINPKALERYQQLWMPSSRMVHYSQSVNLINIAKSNSIWLHNIENMEDKTEMKYGYEPLQKFINSNKAIKLWNFFDNKCNGLSEKIKYHINGHGHSLLNNTYIFCICEFDPQVPVGTVEMWKEYARLKEGDGVSVKINPIPMRQISDAVGANSYPVIYEDKDALFTLLEDTSERILDNNKLFLELSEEEIFSFMWSVVEQFVYGSKDPFFKNEKEWRVVYNPIVRGENQIMKAVDENSGKDKPKNFALPLQDVPGLTGLTIKDFLSEVLIPDGKNAMEIKSNLEQTNQDLQLGLSDSSIKIIDLPISY
ncbi:MAG: DUF2971 domain-containing protein [Hyphomicrobiales bacterium]|jgi:hypothetical protein